MTRTVFWFRRDLRLADNPALLAAASEGAVLPLFVFDPLFLRRSGANRLRFLHESLDRLGQATEGALTVRTGDPAELVPAVADAVGARVVFATDDFGPYGRRRDADVAAALERGGRSLRLVGSPYAVAPGSVVKSDGDPYAVFTPFSRSWAAVGWERPVGQPAIRWKQIGGLPGEPPPAPPLIDAGLPVLLPPAGEHAAHERWDAFVAQGLDGYGRDRDRPDLDVTSRLSPYLRFGALHPRQLLADLGARKSHEVFADELAWREFYADVLFRRPATAWENLDRRMDALPVDTDADARRRFDRWREGRTGFPIVDAGMRQLLATGWMHNRVRMTVASFLVKDLHLPWQWGARHFLVHLVDGDLASNNHGWQWTAGTGTDAAPYFRIFNPVSQSERFDPDGAYIRRWVSELAGLEGPDVHAPWTSKRGGPESYPGPMVDHGAERQEALRRFGVVVGQ